MVVVPRIDTHQHVIPPNYRQALAKAGADSTGAGALPEWNPQIGSSVMADLDEAAAILSAPTPGTTFLPRAADAAAMARYLNDYCADLVATDPDRLGFFATLPTPHLPEAVTEAHRALQECRADGVMLLANSAGVYLGQDGQHELFAVLDQHSAVVFIHPAGLPGPPVVGIPPFAADFLLDTTRAAYLLVRNGIRRDFPNIRFVLSHAGGFVPYAAQRLAISIAGDTGRNVPEVLSDFAGFYFDTALSSSPAALPTLLAFATPGHIVFGSDCPFAPTSTATYFAEALAHYSGLDAAGREAIERSNAEALFPRFAT